MGGFCAGFVRIPENTDPEAFAEAIADNFFSWPETRTYCRVQYAQGYEWLHIWGFDDQGSSIDETVIHPALRPMNAETISLSAHDGSGVYFYRHHLRGTCLRVILVCEGQVRQNLGDVEIWEKSRMEELIAEHGAEAAWPRWFKANDVIKAFRLPSPWDDGPQVWDLDFCWER